jgi:flagellar biosynthetic protein FlhB
MSQARVTTARHPDGDDHPVSNGRTEPATPKRRREARRKGQVARSAELAQGLGLVIAVVLLPVVLPKLAAVLRADWAQAAELASHGEPGSAVGLLGRFTADAVAALLPLFAALAVVGVAAGVAMVGATPNLHQLKPKWSHLNPRQGVKRIVSKQAAWELMKTTTKLAALAAVSYTAWRAGFRSLTAGPLSFRGFTRVMGESVAGLLLRVAVLAALIGAVDAVVAKRRHMKQLRMTKQEVKEEHKQSEGNPVVKGEIRKRQMKLSRSRMIAAVAKADVVLTNPTHLAIALTYAPGAAAPIVVAKGAGSIAERIRAEARRHGVPVQENKPLARALFRAVEVGDAIPVALYRAVAEVLAIVFRAKRRPERPSERGTRRAAA